MRSNSFIRTSIRHKKTLIANEPIDGHFWTFNREDDDDEASDSQWLIKARRLQARRWRKIKHNIA